MDPTAGPPDGPSAVAFVDVRVVPMDRKVVLPAHTVLVRDGRIEALGPAGEVTVPGDAEVIDGRGRWLMPGLADAHVHMGRAEAPLYVSYGVTTVRNMWGWPGLREIVGSIEDGSLVGPTVYSYSSGLDAPPEYWPFTQMVTTPERAREVVRAQLDRGWIGIKVYTDLSVDVYDAIVDETHALGRPVVGHVPARVGLERALAAGQRSIEHLLGYSQALTGSFAAWPGPFDAEGMASLADRTREANTWNCPTIEILRRAGRPGHENRLRAIASLHEAGAELLVGTDSGIDVTEPGLSIRSELAHFQGAGLTPYEALRDATVDVARFLGREGEFGVVATGARADLLLLSADPLERVENVGSLDGVLLRGRWFPGGG